MIVIDGEEYLTGPEAARLLGVKAATLYAYVSRGLVRSYRQGIKKRRLYRRAELQAMVRLAPSAELARLRAGRGRRHPAEIPLAENWIRE